jgi:signal transduction histidine kinase
VDVRAGVETTLTLFAHKFRDRRVRLARDLPAGLPRVKGFAGELNQVWTNLLDNAIDAAAESESGEPHVAVRARREDGRVVVEVEDNGRGVPPEIQSRIWEPFFTTKEVGRGTGLGLDIARHVVEQHGGELALDSQPGRTRFAVRLPAA